MYRQGDVLVFKDKLPQNLKPVENEDKTVLAYGEVTGHAHRLNDKDNVTMLFAQDSIDRFLQLKAPMKLQHEEHGAIPLDAGTYTVRRQTEYRYGSVRNVED